jgi:mRNA interferase RelE/StbE
LSGSFRISETHNFVKKVEGKFQKVYSKLLSYIYPQLRENPFFGPNIKKLKGELEGIYRYRTGRYRIFYTIDEDKKMIFIIDIDDRKDVYK